MREGPGVSSNGIMHMQIQGSLLRHSAFMERPFASLETSKYGIQVRDLNQLLHFL